jgi:hypothetical protein
LERFARIILGYHGTKAGEAAAFAKKLLVGDIAVDEWRPSENEFDWLGHGIYFWEHSPERARRWAGPDGVVIGAVIQLGNCLDLTDLRQTELLAFSFGILKKGYEETNLELPQNTGRDFGNRKLDCLVINNVTALVIPGAGEHENRGREVQTVRGAFEEGEEAFPGAVLKKETHIQVAVRDRQCILGIFRPVN